MTSMMVQNPGQDKPACVACDDCDWEGTEDDLDAIADIEERVCAAEIMPAGQCPKCCALAHLKVAPDWSIEARMAKTEARCAELEQDAKRWRALMSSPRMHYMGSAGFAHDPKDGDDSNRNLTNLTPRATPGAPLHFGMEFWSKHPAGGDPQYPDDFARAVLLTYVDAMIERNPDV